MRFLAHIGAGLIGLALAPTGMWLADVLPTGRGGMLLGLVFLSLAFVWLSQVLVIGARAWAGERGKR